MYSIYDKNAAIRNIQRMLSVSQTGLYDSDTEKAVLVLQERYSLVANGTVDYNTFSAIVDNYKQKMYNKQNPYLLDPKYPYKYGDIGDSVLLINQVINYILRDYSFEGVLPRGIFFGKDTVNAVRFLRKVFMMSESDEVDTQFLNRALIEKDAIDVKTNFR